MKKHIIPIAIIVIILAGAGIWYANRTSPSSLPIAQVTYNCTDGKTIDAAFYQGKAQPVQPGEPPIPSGSVKIVLSDGRNFDLPQTISADGSRYANSDESLIFWSKGDNAFIVEANTTTYKDCSVWEIYKNAEGKYSFKYPGEWNAVTNKYNAKNSLFGPGATADSGNGGVEFSGTLSPGQSLKDFVKAFNSGVEGGSTSETETTLNKQTVIISILPKAATEPTEVKSVSFENDGQVFNMYLMYRTNFTKYPEDKQMLDTFNQMISTFSF